MRSEQSLSFGFRSELQLSGPVALKEERAARPVFPCRPPDAKPGVTCL
jgi:hypothetical protein